MIFTTPVCDSGVVLGYIDLFIKLLLGAEKTDFLDKLLLCHACLSIAASG